MQLANDVGVWGVLGFFFGQNLLLCNLMCYAEGYFFSRFW